MTSISGRGCAHGFGVGFLLAASVVDILYVGNAGHSVWPTALVLLAGLAAVMWPLRRRPVWFTPQLRTAVPALLSALYTAGALLSGRAVLFGPGETAILLCLLFIAVRDCPPRWAVACGLLDLVALLATPVRYSHTLSGTQGGETLAFMVVGLALTTRYHLRSGEGLNLAPSRMWPAPLVRHEPEPERGPVLVTVQYLIDPARRLEFTAAMRAVRRIRLRDGAMEWGLFADAAVEHRMVEIFLVKSWIEHLRQHERVTFADRDVEERARSFHVGEGPPVVHHLIAERVPRQVV